MMVVPEVQQMVILTVTSEWGADPPPSTPTLIIVDPPPEVERTSAAPEPTPTVKFEGDLPLETLTPWPEPTLEPTSMIEAASTAEPTAEATPVPTLEIDYWEHAEGRMALRGITDTMVRLTLEDPDEVGAGQEDRLLSYRGFPEGTVIVVHLGDPLADPNLESVTVVTVMWDWEEQP